MKKTIAILVILYSTFGLKAQDYFPIVPGSYWVYDVYNDGILAYQDSTVFNKSEVINDTTFYLFIHHYMENNEVTMIDTFFLYDNTVDNNAVMLSDRNMPVVDSAVYGKHTYTDGEFWVYTKNSGPDTIWVESIDNLAVSSGEYSDCYLQGDEYYLAPDIGIVKIILWNAESYYDLVKFYIPDNVLSTDRIGNKDFGIYPNPVSEYLSVQNINVSEYKIYSVNGVLYRRGEYTTRGIYVGDLKQGIYLLIVEDEGFSSSRKFIKQ
jgi:hypothetical protein